MAERPIARHSECREGLPPSAGPNPAPSARPRGKGAPFRATPPHLPAASSGYRPDSTGGHGSLGNVTSVDALVPQGHGAPLGTP